MGYDHALLLASIFLFVPALILSFIALLVMQKLRFVPKGSATVSISHYVLMLLSGYALLFLGCAIDMLAVTPTRLQIKYLGRAYGTPLSLRHYEHGGFQDPYDQWHFILNARYAETLGRKCDRPRSDPDRCILYSAGDDRWSADVWLEGQALHMVDGLH